MNWGKFKTLAGQVKSVVSWMSWLDTVFNKGMSQLKFIINT